VSFLTKQLVVLKNYIESSVKVLKHTTIHHCRVFTITDFKKHKCSVKTSCKAGNGLFS